MKTATTLTYVTSGWQCRRGHLNAPRYFSNNMCVWCVRNRDAGVSIPRVLTARQAAAAEGRELFDIGRICNKGHGTVRRTNDGKCPSCVSEYVRSLPRGAAYRQQELSARKQKYAEDEAYRSKVNDRKKKWRESSVEWRREYHRRYREENAGRISTLRSRHEERLRRATPAWLTDFQLAVMEVYYTEARRRMEVTSELYEVDHIVPLQGNNVCGLNVPWNLQILTAVENRRKGNSLPPEDETVCRTARGYQQRVSGYSRPTKPITT